MVLAGQPGCALQLCCAAVAYIRERSASYSPNSAPPPPEVMLKRLKALMDAKRRGDGFENGFHVF